MAYYSEKAEQMFDQEKFGSNINHYVEAFGDMDVHQAAKLQPIIDEFEKIFSGEKQQHILTLLDGVFSTHKLFLLTCNDKWKIDSHMRNRPGRIYYMIEFEGLEPTVHLLDACCRRSVGVEVVLDKLRRDLIAALRRNQQDGALQDPVHGNPPHLFTLMPVRCTACCQRTRSWSISFAKGSVVMPIAS